MGDSRHCADVGDSSHIEGEGSSHVRGGGESGRRCRPVEPMMGHHQEAWGRKAPGARISGRFCITEYVIGVGTQVGYTGNYADVRIVYSRETDVSPMRGRASSSMSASEDREACSSSCSSSSMSEKWSPIVVCVCRWSAGVVSGKASDAETI